MKKIMIETVFVIILMLTFAVPVHSLEGVPQISITMLNQDPDPVSPGQSTDVRFKISNTQSGSVAENFEVMIDPSYPFSLVENGTSLQQFGNLPALGDGSNAIITKFKIKVDSSAIEGEYDLRIRYRHGNSDWITIPFKVNVKSGQLAQIIYLDKAQINPGKETQLKFTITNIGNSPLNNLAFSWNEKNSVILPVYSDDTKYIKHLDVGESTDLVYTVVANVNAAYGLYQLNLNLKFDADNATSKEINTKAGVLIGGETDFDVSFSESSAGATSLSIANIGNNPSQSVTVRIPNQPNFRVTGSSSSIVGNLNNGDYTIVSFQITSLSSLINASRRTTNTGSGQASGQSANGQTPQFNRNQTQGSNLLKVIIDYTDTTGVRRSVEKNIPIQLRSATDTATSLRTRQQSSPTRFIIPGIIIVAVIGAGVFFFRRRAAKKVKK